VRLSNGRRNAESEGKMSDDDDMLFSMLVTALTVMVVLFVVGGVGLIIWSWL
jgi:hypothetical protein